MAYWSNKERTNFLVLRPETSESPEDWKNQFASTYTWNLWNLSESPEDLKNQFTYQSKFNQITIIML